MKRALSLLFCIVFLFSFCACHRNGKGNLDNKGGSEVVSKPINIPYSREEGLNPYQCRSLINYCIMPLMYGSLYKIDRSYYPEADIAVSYEYKNLTFNVKIDTSRKFSNGRYITPEDVVYSFRAAKQSSIYASMLRYVSTAVELSEDEVQFVTAVPDYYAASDLTFPIIPADSGNIPASSGPYIYKSTTDGGTLTRNKQYPKNDFTATTINLINTTDTTSLNMGLVIGTIDAWYDEMKTGESKRIASGAAQVDLNNLVYLGFNYAKYFGDEKLRQAIAIALDKQAILESGYEGYGQATNVPFNPLWYAADGVAWEAPMTVDEAKEYITERLDHYTVTLLITDGNGFRLKCAQRISDQFAELGVETKIDVAGRELFDDALENGRYDIYIGEYKMSNDMLSSSLYWMDAEVQAKHFGMISGSVTPSEFMVAFTASQPIIPLVIRYGVVSYSKSLQGGVEPLPNNPFANLSQWYK
ncbi:MAG: ABC transporter substrate-binding protein [Clostridia bacterium]|nr:ABC transporter substrate-binding protein [Clostridia bacterium]MBR5991135.1 ABC transporter substrate-binding protein [Clostridia bacterium]